MQSNKWDEKEAHVGGGRVYGEYEKGPYKAGAEYNWDENYGPNLGDGGGYNPAPHLGDGPNLGGGGGYNPAPHLDMSSPRWDEDDNDDGLGIGSYFRGGRRAYGVGGRQA